MKPSTPVNQSMNQRWWMTAHLHTRRAGVWCNVLKWLFVISAPHVLPPLIAFCRHVYKHAWDRMHTLFGHARVIIIGACAEWSTLECSCTFIISLLCTVFIRSSSHSSCVYHQYQRRRYHLTSSASIIEASNNIGSTHGHVCARASTYAYVRLCMYVWLIVYVSHIVCV